MLEKKGVVSSALSVLWLIAAVLWGYFARVYRGTRLYEYKIFAVVSVLLAVVAVILAARGVYLLYYGYYIYKE